jgi:hypothetical protein
MSQDKEAHPMGEAAAELLPELEAEEAVQALRNLSEEEPWEEEVRKVEDWFVGDYEGMGELTKYEHKIGNTIGDIFYYLRVGDIDDASADWELLRNAKPTELLTEYGPKIEELLARWGRWTG